MIQFPLKWDGVSVTPCRRGYQTALRCKTRKIAVVNGQGKGLIKKDQVSSQEMNESESLFKVTKMYSCGKIAIS